MKTLLRSTGPLALMGLLGAVLALMSLFWLASPGGGAPELSSPAAGSLLAAPFRSDLASWAQRNQSALLPELAVLTEVTCTLEITTTDKAPFDNHSIDTAATIANYTGQSLLVGVGPHAEGSLVSTQPDFYRLDNASPGYKYTVQAKPDRTLNYNLGMIVYNRDRVPIITDTNTFDNNFASVSLVPTDYGPYYFKVFQISEQCSGHTYSLILGATAPTATPVSTSTPTPQPTTATPQPTWMAGFDQYEPNYTFGLATTLAPGVSYEMNFVPWGNADVDNDFLKVRVKPGLQLTCQTSDLDPGVDPRMVFYTGPGEQYQVMANDDIALGDFNSRLSYYATFEGYVYILVGQGARMSKQDTVNSDYTIRCELDVPGQATPRPGQPTPPSKAPIATAAATPRTSPLTTPTPPTSAATLELTFRLISTPAPVTATPEPSGFRTFRVLIYYDRDGDGQMGAGEGVTGFFVLVLSPDGSRELAQGYTDEQGQLSFTVSTVGTVRVVVPLLGFDRLVDASRPEVKVRIAPPTLPQTIP
ncbi:MAG: hypothetical protein ACP5HS_12190 [Anaerolineae bacterium]